MKKLFGLLMLLFVFVGVAISAPATSDVAEGVQQEYILSHSTILDVIEVEGDAVFIGEVTPEVVILGNLIDYEHSYLIDLPPLLTENVNTNKSVPIDVDLEAVKDKGITYDLPPLLESKGITYDLPPLLENENLKNRNLTTETKYVDKPLE